MLVAYSLLLVAVAYCLLLIAYCLLLVAVTVGVVGFVGGVGVVGVVVGGGDAPVTVVAVAVAVVSHCLIHHSNSLNRSNSSGNNSSKLPLAWSGQLINS